MVWDVSPIPLRRFQRRELNAINPAYDPTSDGQLNWLSKHRLPAPVCRRLSVPKCPPPRNIESTSTCRKRCMTGGTKSITVQRSGGDGSTSTMGDKGAAGISGSVWSLIARSSPRNYELSHTSITSFWN